MLFYRRVYPSVVGSVYPARKSRDFTRADQIRKDLAAKGVILEDTKDGTRWKYSD